MHEDLWRDSYDAWKQTEPDPHEENPTLGPCDGCDEHYATQQVIVGPHVRHLCDRCAEREIRR